MNKFSSMLFAGAMALSAASEGCTVSESCQVTPAHDAVTLNNVNAIQSYCAKATGSARKLDCVGIDKNDDMSTISTSCDDPAVLNNVSKVLLVLTDDNSSRSAVGGMCYGGGASIKCEEK